MSYRYPNFSKYFTNEQPLPTEIMMIIQDFCRLSIKKRAAALLLKKRNCDLTVIGHYAMPNPYIFHDLYNYEDSTSYCVTIRPFDEEFRKVYFYDERTLEESLYVERHSKNNPLEVVRYYFDNDRLLSEIQAIKPGVKTWSTKTRINANNWSLYSLP